MSGKIRNILQSVQEREVIKQAPDIAVYIDGQAYLTNYFLGAEGTTVPFNDYVTAFQAGYDIDNFIPSCSITLVVPYALDSLFRAPGGNNILKTMSEVRVFMKGFYFSERGNSMYYQVFRGYLSAISYKPDSKHTTINLTCRGVMGLLEKMQLDLKPSASQSASMHVTPLTSNQASMSPYGMMQDLFTRKWLIDGFDNYSLKQQKMDKSNPYYNVVTEDIARWNALLYEIARDVHIFGVPDVFTNSKTATKASPADGTKDKDTVADAGKRIGTLSASDDATKLKDYYEAIRNYLPDMSFSSIQLLNSHVVNRLERLTQIVNMVGFEGYQDIDGGIVIKPPLYNLDVTNVGTGSLAANTPAAAVIQAYGVNNPFVIKLSEILDEDEGEDESAIRLTRMTARGSLNPLFQLSGTENIVAVSEEIDLPKLSQFGLRAEPPHNAAWLHDSDVKGLYGFCVSELARANKGFRTYSVVIPVRPELKLGFPIYFPHKDIYAYPKSISISHVEGGDSTMTITMDSLRRRPMFPETQTAPTPDGKSTQEVTLMTTQPNLVLQWTKAPADNGVTSASKSKAQLAGSLATSPLDVADVHQQQLQMIDYEKHKIQNNFEINADTTQNCWRIQEDTDHVFTVPRALVSMPDATATIHNDYFKALRKIRPYTDEKGYELIGPFPWGRWKSLEETVYQFTVSSTIPPTGTSTGTITASVPTTTAASAFLYTGESQPMNSTDAASQVLSTLTATAAVIKTTKVFELTYDSNGAASDANGMQGLTESDAGVISQASQVSADEYERAQTFLNSTPKTSNSVAAILKSYPVTPTTGASS
jgi:hypothetical protein